MTWHSAVVTTEALEKLLNSIRQAAGTIVSCTHIGDRIQVTWTASA